MSSMPSIKPSVPAELDPGFQPLSLVERDFDERSGSGGKPIPVRLGLERENGLVSVHTLHILPGDPDEWTRIRVERTVKFLLWARGGWKLHFGGPPALGAFIAETYGPGGARDFDIHLMEQIYGKPFEVTVTEPDQVPTERAAPKAIGGHLDGCRIGFDLGASDYKLAAVEEGEVRFSDEFPWNPKDQADPDYHYQKLSEGLQAAAASLPRVDAIGGSTAGVVVDNRMMVASLFRSVPEDRFEEASHLFERIAREWKVPLTVVNDGEVTALAGSMSLEAHGVLGIAMGSSEAVGFIAPDGRIQGWLNELAFAPIDLNPTAMTDEWSGDCGVGARYFSQQAVEKLAPAAGFDFPAEMPLPERLKKVQKAMEKGDERAAAIYRTLGTYLGYALPWYARFYSFEHVLLLGRVVSGPGGILLLETALEALKQDFPDLAGKIALHLPDERIRRVGQAVAAASLPALA